MASHLLDLLITLLIATGASLAFLPVILSAILTIAIGGATTKAFIAAALILAAGLAAHFSTPSNRPPAVDNPGRSLRQAIPYRRKVHGIRRVGTYWGDINTLESEEYSTGNQNITETVFAANEIYVSHLLCDGPVENFERIYLDSTLIDPGLTEFGWVNASPYRTEQGDSLVRVNKFFGSNPQTAWSSLVRGNFVRQESRGTIYDALANLRSTTGDYAWNEHPQYLKWKAVFSDNRTGAEADRLWAGRRNRSDDSPDVRSLVIENLLGASPLEGNPPNTETSTIPFVLGTTFERGAANFIPLPFGTSANTTKPPAWQERLLYGIYEHHWLEARRLSSGVITTGVSLDALKSIIPRSMYIGGNSVQAELENDFMLFSGIPDQIYNDDAPKRFGRFPSGYRPPFSPVFTDRPRPFNLVVMFHPPPYWLDRTRGEYLVFNMDTQEYEHFAWLDGQGESRQLVFRDNVDVVVNQTSNEAFANHRLDGIAYMGVRLIWDSEVFRGIPNFSAVVKGSNDIYDPRDGTHKWTDNPALCLANFINDPVWGKGDPNLTEAQRYNRWGNLSAAADICDEILTTKDGTQIKRYECNALIISSDTRETIIAKYLDVMSAFLSYQAGKWWLYPGTPNRQVAHHVTDDVIIGSVQRSLAAEQRSRANTVIGDYFDRDDLYERSNYSPVQDKAAIAQDGQIIDVRADFDFCTSHAHAQRLAKIRLLEAQHQTTLTLTCDLSTYKIIAGDIVEVSIKRLGYDRKLFRVNSSVDASTALEPTKQFTLQEWSKDIYGFDPVVDEQDPPRTDDPVDLGPPIVPETKIVMNNENNIRLVSTCTDPDALWDHWNVQRLNDEGSWVTVETAYLDEDGDNIRDISPQEWLDQNIRSIPRIPE